MRRKWGEEVVIKQGKEVKENYSGVVGNGEEIMGNRREEVMENVRKKWMWRYSKEKKCLH